MATHPAIDFDALPTCEASDSRLADVSRQIAARPSGEPLSAWWGERVARTPDHVVLAIDLRSLTDREFDADFSGEALYDTLSADLPDYAPPLFVRVGKGESALTETCELALATLKTQGYSPARIDDRLFLLDRAAGGYVPLTDEALHEVGLPPFDRLEVDGSGECE